LYVATDASNTSPGPNGNNTTQIAVPLLGGFANATVNASGEWYMSVSAPALPEGFEGVWNYDLAVSIVDYYHSANLTSSSLALIDTDYLSALLVTPNLTTANTTTNTDLYNEWLSLSPPPFTLFAADVNDPKIMGIQNSYCGWSNANVIVASQADVEGNTTHVQMSMITRGIGGNPKEQFYLTELDPSTTYVGVLALDGNSTDHGDGVVGGGGKVWQPVPFTTHSTNNCALLFNLTFCDQVAYAVPSNPNYTNASGLFDNYTQAYYQQFNYSLQQIPCNTTSDAQYSLVKNCTDCATAYKEWLCAVSIPRCEDFSLFTPPASGLRQPRNMGQKFFENGTFLPDSVLNSLYTPMSKAPTVQGSNAYEQTYLSSFATNTSRNAIIDNIIMPGPYNEVLPCEDLCYSLVQSCPASLGFACPYPGRGLEVGYAPRVDNVLNCNYPGAVYPPPPRSASPDMLAPVFRAVTLAALVALLLGVV